MEKNKQCVVPLCHRCEHRALWYETKGTHRPRFECAGMELGQQVPPAVYSCYMYQPIKPVVISSNKGDDRPLMPIFSHFSGRSSGVRVAAGTINIRKYKDGITWYWIPTKERDKKGNKKQ